MPGRGGAKGKHKGKQKSSETQSHSAAKPQAGRQSPLSFREKAKPVDRKEKHSSSAGETASAAATKGRHSSGSTGASLEVKGVQPTAGSRTSGSYDAREKGNRRKMEDMEVDRNPSAEMKSTKSPSGLIPTTPTDKHSDHGEWTRVKDPKDHAGDKGQGRDNGEDWDKGQSGNRGQGQDTPSAAGGDSHYDFSDSDDPDAGGYADKMSDEDDRTQKPSLYDANRTWKGLPLEKLKTTPTCLPPEMKLERSSQHFIAVSTPFKYKPDQIPFPYQGSTGKWDSEHVRMPFAYESKCIRNGREEKRWDIIVAAFTSPIPGPFELEEAILKYNQRYINKWKFTVLHHFFLKHVSKTERVEFFETVLPQLIKLALRLPEVCPLIPLLKKGKPKKLTLSQYQISCLLANAFLCTFPLRNSRKRACEYSDYPDINFSHLFVGDPVSRKLEKLKCIVHYFKKVLYKEPTGIVTFSRQVLSSPYSWHNSVDNLTGLHVASTGTIEDNGRGMLQVDFANKYLGGGVLGHGCVQEEIRFMICPEMIITRLFTQSLDPLESLLMTGCERYSDYEGYSDSFRWKGDYDDDTPRDDLGRLCCEVVAIDAQIFKSDYAKQFKRTSLERELNKAYSGFKTSAKEVYTPAVCTGNWGCGAFGGDKQLKALIQIMAASMSKRDVCYFTFDDEHLAKEIFDVHDHLRRKEKTVGDVYNMLEDYGRTELGGRWSHSRSLFDFIHHQLSMDVKTVRRSTHLYSPSSVEVNPDSKNSWFHD